MSATPSDRGRTTPRQDDVRIRIDVRANSGASRCKRMVPVTARGYSRLRE